MSSPNPTENAVQESGPLSMWDSVSLIIGIVIGSSIYKTPGLIFRNVADAWTGLALWILCGGLSFAGALCYAELATTYPRSGGEYNYLTRAFGRWAGFLFGWAQLSLIQTGSIGALSYVFAEYASNLFGLPPSTTVWFAVGAVVGLTLLNMIGVNAGRHTQKALAVAKIVGLSLLIWAGLSASSQVTFEVKNPIDGPGWPLALILVLYAYGGWNDAGFVTAEVRDRSKNIPRSLLLGLGIITLVYLLVNLAYLRALGFEGLRKSDQPAADAFAAVLGEHAAQGMRILVIISSLGGLNGLILSVSRVHATVGTDHAMFSWLAHWSARMKTPIRSLLVQGVVTVIIIVAVGTEAGRNLIDQLLATGKLPSVPWARYYGGFDTLVAGSAPIFWLSFLATGIAYFVLRYKDRNQPRPFNAPLFPLCPILFCGMSGFGLYSATQYAAPLLPLISVPFAMGLPLYWISQALGRKDLNDKKD